ncbi:MAG: EB domain-containing protein, partial [Sandaracinaceae bacterium]
MRTRWILALSSCALWACSASPNPGDSCSDDSDCMGGGVCIDGMCETRPARDGGGAGDASADEDGGEGFDAGEVIMMDGG